LCGKEETIKYLKKSTKEEVINKRKKNIFRKEEATTIVSLSYSIVFNPLP